MEEVQRIYKFDLLNLTIEQVVQLELKNDDNIGNYLLETKCCSTHEWGWSR